MRQISVRLDEELIKKIKKRAIDNGETVQKMVTNALIQYLHNPVDDDTTVYRLTLTHEELRTFANAAFDQFRKGEEQPIVVRTTIKEIEKDE
jgi:NAD+--asparagine ADP-ribosyltransferase